MTHLEKRAGEIGREIGTKWGKKIASQIGERCVADPKPVGRFNIQQFARENGQDYQARVSNEQLLDASDVDADFEATHNVTTPRETFAAKVSKFTTSQARTLFSALPGGDKVTSDLDDAEAVALFSVRPFLEEYFTDLKGYRSSGVSLFGFIRSRLADDEGGTPFTSSDPERMALKSAVEKQEVALAAKYGSLRRDKMTIQKDEHREALQAAPGQYASPITHPGIY